MNTIYKNTADEKKLAQRIFLEELKECEKFPKYIMIESIDVCNASCTMCNAGIHMNDKDMVRHGAMTMELFEEIIRQMQPYSDWIEMVILVGRGESLLDKTLESKIKRLREIGIKRVQLSTNASLLSPEKAERLFESGLNDLRISIDSIRKDVYENIRRGLISKKLLRIRKKRLKYETKSFLMCRLEFVR